MPASSADRSATVRARFRTEGPQVLRILVAAALSWQLCIWLGADQPPIFAVIVPIVALRDHPYSAFNLSFDRLIGVVGGVGLAVAVVQWLGPSVVSVTLVLAIGLVVGIVLRVGPTLNVQIAVSGLLVFANPDPDAYAVARLWETAIGAAVSVLLSPLLLPPNARKAFEAELRTVTGELVAQLDDLASILAGRTEQAALDRLRDRAAETDEKARRLPQSLAAAQRAVRQNPLRRRDRSPLNALTPVVDLSLELARVERLLVEEVADLSDPPGSGVPLGPTGIGGPAGVATGHGRRPLRARSRARPRRERSGAEWTETSLDRGHAELKNWAMSDDRPISAVLRRPLRRLLGHRRGLLRILTSRRLAFTLAT